MLVWSEILIRLFLAAFLAALIGMERERKDLSAGARTHMMVGVGSCLFMIVSMYGFMEVLSVEGISLDPSRVAAGVVSGIGFIGAGAILFLRDGVVRGLTTAAGLWTVAAIGLAAGGGLYFAAVVTTVVALMVLWAMDPLMKVMTEKYRQAVLHIVTDSKMDNMHIVERLREQEGLDVASYTVEQRKKQFTFVVRLKNINEAREMEIMEMLKRHPEVKEFMWTR